MSNELKPDSDEQPDDGFGQETNPKSAILASLFFLGCGLLIAALTYFQYDLAERGQLVSVTTYPLGSAFYQWGGKWLAASGIFCCMGPISLFFLYSGIEAYLLKNRSGDEEK